MVTATETGWSVRARCENCGEMTAISPPLETVGDVADRAKQEARDG